MTTIVRFDKMLPSNVYFERATPFFLLKFFAPRQGPAGVPAISRAVERSDTPGSESKIELHPGGVPAG